MSDEPTRPDKPKRSPLRPQRPTADQESSQESPKPETKPTEPQQKKRWASEPESASQRLTDIREKMARTALEFSQHKLNKTQFNAIYGHYQEQRKIIEQIVSRDPLNQGWKQVGRSGRTSFLRDHFQAMPQNYVIFLHHKTQALMGDGERPDMQQIGKLLRVLWSQATPKKGIARMTLREKTHLVMAVGDYGVTFVTFDRGPSGAQMQRVHDLHRDFERANQIFLAREQIQRKKMVFPQRSLLENRL